MKKFKFTEVKSIDNLFHMRADVPERNTRPDNRPGKIRDGPLHLDQSLPLLNFMHIKDLKDL